MLVKTDQLIYSEELNDRLVCSEGKYLILAADQSYNETEALKFDDVVIYVDPSKAPKLANGVLSLNGFTAEGEALSFCCNYSTDGEVKGDECTLYPHIVENEFFQSHPDVYARIVAYTSKLKVTLGLLPSQQYSLSSDKQLLTYKPDNAEAVNRVEFGMYNAVVYLHGDHSGTYSIGYSRLEKITGQSFTQDRWESYVL